MELNRKCYVYKFLDIDNKYMYVGETVNIDRRIGEHLQMKSGKFNKELLKRIQRIEYIKVDNKVIARQFELYFINKHNPYLNISDKYPTVVFLENKYYERQWKVYKILRDPNVTLNSTQRKLAMVVPYVLFLYIVISYFI